MAVKFIAECDAFFGKGTTLEEAFDALENKFGSVPVDGVTWYEINEIEVQLEFKKVPVKKEK